MNKNIKWIVGIVAILAIIFFIGNSVGGNNQSVSKVLVGGVTNYDTIETTALTVGTNCGNDYSTCTGASISSVGKIIEAGVLSTTTSVSTVLQPTDLAYSTINMVPIVGDITITLPATTTSGMSTFLPNAGDKTTIEFVNATTTQVANITLAGNTGVLLTNASTSAVLRASFKNGTFVNGVGHLLLIRKSNTDISAQLVPSI